MPLPLAYVFTLVFGTVMGSFFNAFVWRFPREEKITDEHSVCVHCTHVLGVLDLIPVLSYLFLRGKCRYCRQPIPWHYPVVELTVGGLFILALAVLGPTPAFLATLLLGCFLILLFLLDLRYSVLPDTITLPGVVAGAVVAAAFGRSFESIVIGGILGGVFFLIQFLISRGKWIGGGDIRLGALMGVALGWKLLVVAMLLAYLSGSVIGVFLLLSHRKGWKSHIPFGTFLTAATFATLLWGERLLAWYTHLVYF